MDKTNSTERMKVAVIDIGTNTFNLLIQDLSTNELIFKNKISVRLGEGGITKNEIAPPAFERGLNAIEEHKKTCLLHNTKKVFAFATSAVRSAGNGQGFVDTVYSKTDVKINVINGDEEASLIYEGVNQAVNFTNKCALIVDIGGGSTEFIIANKEKAHWKRSYLLGSSRLMEKFKPNDPITDENISRLESHFDNELKELFTNVKKYPISEIIGSSGSFDTLADMIIERFDSAVKAEDSNTYNFNLDQYREIAKLMLESDCQTRLNTPGMIPMRADLIVLACVLINYILKKIKPERMSLSTYALKEGVFATLNKDNTTWQESLL